MVNTLLQTSYWTVILGMDNGLLESRIRTLKVANLAVDIYDLDVGSPASYFVTRLLFHKYE